MSTQQTGNQVGESYASTQFVDDGRPVGFVTQGNFGARVDGRTLPNRIQWGPILGGFVTSVATMLILTALGLAIGASAFKPGVDVTDWGTWAGIYGMASALVAFFVGGWLAAKSSSTGGAFAALANGFVSGALTLLWLVWFSTTSLMNIVGFVGANVANVANAVSNADVTTGSIQSAANSAASAAPVVTYGDVTTGAWITFIVLVALLAAAAIGGLLGRNDRAEVSEPVA